MISGCSATSQRPPLAMIVRTMARTFGVSVEVACQRSTQADRDDALLQRGVGKPGARVERQRVRPVATRAVRQLPNEGCDLGPAGDERVDTVPLAVLEDVPTGVEFG